MTLSSEAWAYLERFDAQLLGTSRGRRVLTRLNPRLFALVYLRHHLSDPSTGGEVSFSEAHLAWYEQMLEWAVPTSRPKAWRRAYVAPRHSAKSTTWFLIAPLWAAAHGHVKFAAAFADNAGLAEQHLASFKSELEQNALLRLDYPELCAPAVRRTGVSVSDNRGMAHQKSGFIFAARGVGSTPLGLKVGNLRPDLLIFDDIEPPAATYSTYQMGQRLDLVRQALLPLNANARVAWVGTVTMEGSMVHQLVKSVTTSEAEPWIAAENFRVSYYPALVLTDEGTERSLWPEKWTLEELQAMKGDRYFAINFQNEPLAADGLMWSTSDITYETRPTYPRTFLSVDPAVTSRKTSDATGLAVLSHDRQTGKVWVRECLGVRLNPKALRTKVASLLVRYPEIRLILVETNQGGDVWREVLGEFPDVVYETKHQTILKETRAELLLNGYQRRQVVHTQPLEALERELLAFPKGLHDDMVDAVSTGFAWVTGAGREGAGTLRRQVA